MMWNLNWKDFWPNYLGTLAAIFTLYAIYKIFGHDMIGLRK